MRQMQFRAFFLVVRLSVLVLSVPVTETKLCEVRNPTQLVYPGRMTRLDWPTPSAHEHGSMNTKNENSCFASDSGCAQTQT